MKPSLSRQRAGRHRCRRFRRPSPSSTLTRELNVTDNLNDVLAKTVPGLGPSRETEGIFGQSLRGRDMLVLVDGVPQNFELRIGATDELSRVSPSFLERVEVVRGASAAFGASAAGGIVNLITRTPGRGRLEASVGTSFSATQPDDSFDQRLTLSAGGTRGSTFLVRRRIVFRTCRRL